MDKVPTKKKKVIKHKGTSKKKNIKKTVPKSQNKHNIVKNNNRKIIKTKSNKVFWLIIICVCILMLILGLIYFIINSSMFKIAKIIVSGNNVIDTETVILNSEINIGDNSILKMYTANKQKIIDIPYVEKVEYKMNNTSEIEIKITERIGKYYAYDKEKNIFYLLDKSGIILDRFDRIDYKKDELLVYGITFDNEVSLGNSINEIDNNKLKEYEIIHDIYSKKIPDIPVTKLTFENTSYKIYLNDKVEVILPGKENLDYNLIFLKSILPNIGDVTGTIDMTKNNPTFISK